MTARPRRLVRRRAAFAGAATLALTGACSVATSLSELTAGDPEAPDSSAAGVGATAGAAGISAGAGGASGSAGVSGVTGDGGFGGSAGAAGSGGDSAVGGLAGADGSGAGGAGAAGAAGAAGGGAGSSGSGGAAGGAGAGGTVGAAGAGGTSAAAGAPDSGVDAPQTPTCSDSTLNQDETDVDCGGVCGATCLNTEGCAVHGDCANGFCRPSDDTCRSPTCSDGFLNQGEADVDCGGPCGPCATCWGDASNFDFADPALSFAAAVSLSCSPTIDTSQPPTSMITGWCGAQPTPVVQPQAGGPGVVVVPMDGFHLAAGQILRLIGDKPVVLAVNGDATVDGFIDASAQGTTPGAGGDDARNGAIATAGQIAGTDCDVFGNGTGQGMEDGARSLGGGGAGFRTNGAFGGGERTNFRCYKAANGYECKGHCPEANCDNSFIDSSSRFVANNSAHYAVVPIRGLAAPDLDLMPLRAGCAGGKGDRRVGSGLYFGGSGGGAIQLTVTGTLTVGSTGVIASGGGGGTVGEMNAGGSGGGAGGAILVEATTVSLSASAGLRAHGGGGAGRSCVATAQNGHSSDNVHATSPACMNGGRGGLSYWDVVTTGCNGSAASIGAPSMCNLPVPGWPADLTAYPEAGGFSDNNGGGGGGGSGGVIVVRRLVLAGACG